MNKQQITAEGKILALDLGDQWVGTALSDVTRTLARPLKTVPVDQLDSFLQQLLKEEQIAAVIIGYPQTMGGKISQQTQKVIDAHQKLSEGFPTVPFILWDERLSSKRAEAAHKSKTKEEKIHSHSIAAAFILDSFLRFLEYQRSLDETE